MRPNRRTSGLELSRSRGNALRQAASPLSRRGPRISRTGCSAQALAAPQDGDANWPSGDVGRPEGDLTAAPRRAPISWAAPLEHDAIQTEPHRALTSLILEHDLVRKSLQLFGIML